MKITLEKKTRKLCLVTMWIYPEHFLPQEIVLKAELAPCSPETEFLATHLSGPCLGGEEAGLDQCPLKNRLDVLLQEI